MKSLYIYHHLGMGDHILCNGLVRSYAEKYDRIFVFAKPKYTKNCLYMYRDNPRIKILAMDDFEIRQFISFNPKNDYLIVGHEKLHKELSLGNKSFDEIFYEMANVPFEDKWNKFYVMRDMDREKEVFNKLGLIHGEEYLFVHDDPKIGRNFKSKYLNNHLKMVRPVEHLHIDFFDFIYTIENAKEAHLSPSSFSCLIDTMQLKTGDVYIHDYSRTDMGNKANQKIKSEFIFINQ